MLFDSEYNTITKRSESTYKEKGSKFIAVAEPIESIDDFKNFISKVKSEFPQAVHYCYAYRIGYDKSNYRMNDDGEPSGSAGKPIYNQILSFDLTNVGIIVVRYFGGTLLGVPGLINAYKTSSMEALKQNEIITKFILELIEVEFDYMQMNEVMKIVKEHQLKIKNQESDTRYLLRLEVPKKNAEQVYSAFKLQNIEVKYLKTY